MEQTPFDSFPKSQENAPNSFEDFSQSVPSVPPSVPLPTPPSAQEFGAPFMPTQRLEAPQYSPRSTRKSSFLWVVPLLLIACVGGGFGFVSWDKHQKEVAREQKLADLRSSIKKIVLQDNALVMELLDPDSLEHITYAEFFKRADKNKDSRDDLVRQLRATESGPYGEDVGHYVELLSEENNWVRAEEAVSRAQLDSSSKQDTLTRAIKESSSADGQLESTRQAYMAAPYGSDFSERMDYDLAKSRFKNANATASQSYEEWKNAEEDLKEKKREAFVILADWLRHEPKKYPHFAPPRTISVLLTTRKASYATAASSANLTTSRDAQVVPVSSKLPTPTAQATPTAEPSTPTRTHDTNPLDGERFPQTRMEDVDQDFTSNLSDEDLRYAINEMYARYGMTFKNKSLQSQFEQTSWYHPDDKWTMPQVKAAFSKRELDNLNLLVQERSQRRQGTQEQSAQSWE